MDKKFTIGWPVNTDPLVEGASLLYRTHAITLEEMEKQGISLLFREPPGVDAMIYRIHGEVLEATGFVLEVKNNRTVVKKHEGSID